MSKKAVQEFFGQNAAAYATSKVHAKGASLQRLVELVNPQSTWQALDVATAAGHTGFIFAPRVERVIATDITPQMLTVAADLAAEKGITNVIFEEADAEALQFDDDTFDLVTCRIAPHHFPHIDRFIAESYRVLRKGGVLAVVDNVSPEDAGAAEFYNRFEKLRDDSHGWCWTLSEWETAFKAAGLTVTALETADKEMVFSSWVDRFKISEGMKRELREMLNTISGAEAEFLRPVQDGDELKFYLTEGIIVGRK